MKVTPPILDIPLVHEPTQDNPPVPTTALGPLEQTFIMEVIELMSREEVLMRLKRDMQTACAIELATIPIYLYTYYSLLRNKNSGKNLTKTQQFVNKAAGHIMSVAVEEMLHMSLASNLYYSITGTPPKLYGSSPSIYPTPLPYHNPIGLMGPKGKADEQVSIPLGKYSYEQLWHFLQIENPGHRDMKPRDRNWDTIGQFYSYIRCLIHSSQLTDDDFQVGSKTFQIQPYNYSPNNVDTVSPNKKFDPWATPLEKNSAAKNADFANSPDSHAGKTQLMTVTSKNDALLAIDTICDQGEGFSATKFDDPSDHELSHYYKFLSLQAQMGQYSINIEQLNTPPEPPKPISPTICESDLVDEKLLYNYPQNPKLAEYPLALQPIVRFCNGLYQYMLIMTETIFYVPAEPNLIDEKQSQKYYFNIALHRSMIWVLDKYIQTLRKVTIQSGIYKGNHLAPTFEFVNLGTPLESFAALKKLGDEAIKATQNARVNVVNSSTSSDIKYYINTALTSTQDDKSMHLPDVADYFQLAQTGPGYLIPKSYPFAAAPKYPHKSNGQPLTQPSGAVTHSCMGLNSCKGQDVYGIAGPTGNDPNQCAGQGLCSTAIDHTCHVQNDCKGQGGCGLYGTAEEMNRPGQNECRSLGSCATPMNAERFITNGEHQGTSVWARARAVFEQEVWPELCDKNPDLKELPSVGEASFVKQHGDIFKDGPSYLWISADNKERSNMTSCGASGMSGAGGCS
ncbi:ferritin-like domain-containing protein [Crocosphaera sp.]|uniref:ferritin-like domain-containing protein n=1 Tax=Crocosphaera sp. TaxID=2729996 RepID=UPI00257D7019|nr:ferritin-like domain-containing protein [Crocosphaera sp.]NQZ64508.1 hypothetical protein [Crocosphaera sp.]